MQYKLEHVQEISEKQKPKKAISVLICHRIPERTFKIRGKYLPVCSRCTGIYLGAFSYFALAYLVKIDYNCYLITAGALMIVPTFLDGFTQLLGMRKSNNTLRFFTGIIAGLGLAILVKALKFYLLVN